MSDPFFCDGVRQESIVARSTSEIKDTFWDMANVNFIVVKTEP